MKPWARWAILAASVVVLVVLFVLLRPDADDSLSATGSTTPSPTPSPTISSASASPTPSGSPQPERTVIDVTYRNGEVQGPTEFTATQGDRVRVIVRADVSDEVHVHGYDLMADVMPQDPARIDFVANAAGVFEVELEDAGELLFRLEIVP
jgi:hypothetical protein